MCHSVVKRGISFHFIGQRRGSELKAKISWIRKRIRPCDEESSRKPSPCQVRREDDQKHRQALVHLAGEEHLRGQNSNWTSGNPRPSLLYRFSLGIWIIWSSKSYKTTIKDKNWQARSQILIQTYLHLRGFKWHKVCCFDNLSRTINGPNASLSEIPCQWYLAMLKMKLNSTRSWHDNCSRFSEGLDQKVTWNCGGES